MSGRKARFFSLNTLLGTVLLTILAHLVALGLGTSLWSGLVALGRLLFVSQPPYQPMIVDVLLTTRRFVIGYTIAIGIGIPVGVLIARNRRVDDVLHIPIEVLRPIPAAVVIPLSLAVFGVAESMKIFVAAFGAVWPIIVYTKAACEKVNPKYIELAKAFHVSKGKLFREIVVPAALPQILGGARAALAIALLLIVTAEMIAGGNPTGIGYFIIDAERSFRYEEMMAGIIVLAVLGYVSNGLFVLGQKMLERNRYSYLRSL